MTGTPGTGSRGRVVPEPIFTGVLALLALLFLPQMVLGDSWIYTELLTERVTLLTAALIKTLFIASGCLYAYKSAAFFERGNPIRPAWHLLALGLGLYFIGQAILSVYQTVLPPPTPFPSIADFFFMVSTTVLIASLVAFVSTYRRGGYPVGSTAELVVVVVIGFAVLGFIQYLLLSPIAAADAPIGEQALNLAYPLTDCLLLIPVTILLRATLKMRGGSLWKVWMLLLGGFISICAGDILFSYFTTMGMSFLDPLLHLVYAGGYVLIAWGTTVQYKILTS